MNIFSVPQGELGLEALDTHIIVEEDKFRTGYECKTCQGERFAPDTKCPYCDGQKFVRDHDNNQMPCTRCECTGLRICTDCNGKGGLIVVPEEAMRRPTTGYVRSVGANVKVLKVGDRVIYTNFVGHAINFKQRCVVRIMREHEVLGKLYGKKEISEALS